MSAKQHRKTINNINNTQTHTHTGARSDVWCVDSNRLRLAASALPKRGRCVAAVVAVVAVAAAPAAAG